MGTETKLEQWKKAWAVKPIDREEEQKFEDFVNNPPANFDLRQKELAQIPIGFYLRHQDKFVNVLDMLRVTGERIRVENVAARGIELSADREVAVLQLSFRVRGKDTRRTVTLLYDSTLYLTTHGSSLEEKKAGQVGFGDGLKEEDKIVVMLLEPPESFEDCQLLMDRVTNNIVVHNRDLFTKFTKYMMVCRGYRIPAECEDEAVSLVRERKIIPIASVLSKTKNGTEKINHLVLRSRYEMEANK